MSASSTWRIACVAARPWRSFASPPRAGEPTAHDRERVPPAARHRQRHRFAEREHEAAGQHPQQRERGVRLEQHAHAACASPCAPARASGGASCARRARLPACAAHGSRARPAHGRRRDARASRGRRRRRRARCRHRTRRTRGTSRRARASSRATRRTRRARRRVVPGRSRPARSPRTARRSGRPTCRPRRAPRAGRSRRASARRSPRSTGTPPRPSRSPRRGRARRRRGRTAGTSRLPRPAAPRWRRPRTRGRRAAGARTPWASRPRCAASDRPARRCRARAPTAPGSPARRARRSSRRATAPRPRSPRPRPPAAPPLRVRATRSPPRLERAGRDLGDFRLRLEPSTSRCRLDGSRRRPRPRARRRRLESRRLDDGSDLTGRFVGCDVRRRRFGQVRTRRGPGFDGSGARGPARRLGGLQRVHAAGGQ